MFSPSLQYCKASISPEQHHVIGENVYLLLGQKSTNLTIFSFHCTYLLLMDVRNIISFANIKKKTYLTRLDEI
jgi:hypothetical protein